MNSIFMKKLGALLIILALVLSLAACGSTLAEASETVTQVPEASESETQTQETPEPETQPEAASVSEYTIRFDLNTTPDTTDDELYVYEEVGYDENWQPITQQKEAVFTVPAGDDAFLDVSLPNPVREGYYFAGWQTRPEVTEDDLVHGVSPYLWILGQKLSYIGQVQVENSPAEEVETRRLHQEAMFLKDLENLDENGNGTLYARWVEIKPISNEEELRAMANDLYGAYELVADIELTEPWTPVGCYFHNYEYYELRWWNFAFRGTLLGNGHTISGLQINGASIDSDAYRTEATATVWHDDGLTCDGTAAMFGATAGATIQDLTIADPVIDVSGEYAFDGEYCYAAVVSAFDMETHLNNVSIENVSLRVDATEKSAQYRDSLYVSVGGMMAGGWNTVADNCSVSGSIELSTENVKSHGGAVYLGGLFGECYSYINNCTASDLSLTLNSCDLSEAAEDTALEIAVGGLNGSNTSAADNSADTVIAVNVSKPVGASSVNVGGFTGSQLYMAAENNTVKSEITADCELDEADGVLNVGSGAGRIDVFYRLQIMQYTPVAQSGVVGNTADVTCNGQNVEAIIAGVPQIDGVPVGWINNGEYEIAEGYTVPSNLEAIIEAYGSYVPQANMMPGIVWITIE